MLGLQQLGQMSKHCKLHIGFHTLPGCHRLRLSSGYWKPLRYSTVCFDPKVTLAIHLADRVVERAQLHQTNLLHPHHQFAHNFLQMSQHSLTNSIFFLKEFHVPANMDSPRRRIEDLIYFHIPQ